MSEPKPSDLALIYKAAQLDIPLPNVTLMAGSFHFKVHETPLKLKSSFFRRALGGSFKEAVTRTINIEADPWIVARLVQFLYFDTYQIRNTQDESTFFDQCHSMTLSELMRHMESVDCFWESESTDKMRSPLDVAMSMFALGHMYMIDDLISAVAANMREVTFYEKCAPEQVLREIFTRTTTDQMDDYPEIKEEVARFVSHHAGLMTTEILRERCLDDPELALQIAQMCANKATAWKIPGNDHYSDLDPKVDRW